MLLVAQTMTMGMHTKLHTGKCFQHRVKYEPYVIIKLDIPGWHVHNRNCPGNTDGILQFRIDKRKIGHRMRIIELQRVRVHAKKKIFARTKRKVLFPEHVNKHIHPVPQYIVITEQSHVRYT